jgi:hypothetical protein
VLEPVGPYEHVAKLRFTAHRELTGRARFLSRADCAADDFKRETPRFAGSVKL